MTSIWNVEKIKKWIYENAPEYYFEDEFYNGVREKHNFRHLVCGTITRMQWSSFHNSGQRCLNCRNLRIGDRCRTPFDEVIVIDLQ